MSERTGRSTPWRKLESVSLDNGACVSYATPDRPAEYDPPHDKVGVVISPSIQIAKEFEAADTKEAVLQACKAIIARGGRITAQQGPDSLSKQAGVIAKAAKADVTADEIEAALQEARNDGRWTYQAAKGHRLAGWYPVEPGDEEEGGNVVSFVTPALPRHPADSEEKPDDAG